MDCLLCSILAIQRFAFPIWEISTIVANAALLEVYEQSSTHPSFGMTPTQNFRDLFVWRCQYLTLTAVRFPKSFQNA